MYKRQLLQPPLAQIDMLNWSAFERAITAGYEYAVRRLEALPPDSLLRESVAEPPPETRPQTLKKATNDR